MNAGSLWAGTEYAWAEYRPRGSFPMGAMRVKVIKVQKVYNYGPNKATVVDVEILDGRWEGQTKQVKARDIVNFWNEYEDERNHRRELRERAVNVNVKRRVDAIRNERAELERKEAEENQKIVDALRARGVEREERLRDGRIRLVRIRVDRPPGQHMPHLPRRRPVADHRNAASADGQRRVANVAVPERQTGGRRRRERSGAANARPLHHASA